MVGRVTAYSGACGEPAGARLRLRGPATKSSRLWPLLLIILTAILTAAIAAPPAAMADPVRAGVSVNVSAGYARLVFSIGDDVDAEAHLAGNVLIVSFSEPVMIAVERIAIEAKDYIGAARRDPDGRAVRFALSGHVKLNAMTAGDKFFVDLLPDTWKGAAPGLPQDVVEELARRTREVERRERLEHRNAPEKKPALIRVRVATQPTFVRYVFDIPEQTAVTADRAKDRLTLSFDARVAFDLSSAQAASPAAVVAINTETGEDSALVRFSFLGKVDLRTFRDGKSYNVDVVTPEARPSGPPKGAGAMAPGPAPESSLPEKPVADNAAAQAVEAAAAMMEKPKVAAPATVAPHAAAAPEAPVPAVTPAAPKAAEAKPAPATPAAPSAAPPAAPMPAVTPAAPKAAEAKPAPTTPPAPPAAPPVAAGGEAKPAPAVPAKSAATASPSAPAEPAATPSRPRSGDALAVELSHQGATLKLTFPFGTPTALAVFQRADTLWIVFDSKSVIDLSALEGEGTRTIRSAEFSRAADAAVVRLHLDRPHLAGIASDGPVWTVNIGDTVSEPTHALDIARNLMGANRASVSIAFAEPHQLHRIRDPEAGDDLMVVTGFAPSRGFISEQDFIEFRTLASTQGVVVEQIADDLNVEISADKIIVSRPGGLTLSSSLQNVFRSSGLNPSTFDAQLWGLDRTAGYNERQGHLIEAAASAPAGKRLRPRLDLARFYIAREMYPEAKGVLDTALSEEHPAAEEVSATVLRSIAEVMMKRPEEALKDLANPAVGDQHDAPLWRALAYASQGKWALARDNFKSVEAAIATLPVELQRSALKDEMRAAIEVGDFAGAADQLNDLETVGLPRELQPGVSVLIGRLAEGMGAARMRSPRIALAADSWDRPAAAQGRLREIALRYSLGDLKREEVVSELETLTTVWRGDETEIEALQILARLYTEQGRYRDSFYVMRAAIAAHPNSDMTRQNSERGGGDVRCAVPLGQGRRHAADRCACAVLRLSRTDADRPPRRRDDPAARRPPGGG